MGLFRKKVSIDEALHIFSSAVAKQAEQSFAMITEILLMDNIIVIRPDDIENNDDPKLVWLAWIYVINAVNTNKAFDSSTASMITDHCLEYISYLSENDGDPLFKRISQYVDLFYTTYQKFNRAYTASEKTDKGLFPPLATLHTVTGLISNSLIEKDSSIKADITGIKGVCFISATKQNMNIWEQLSKDVKIV